VLEVVALDERHREVHETLVIEPHVMHGHDARMLELARDLRLLEKALDQTLLRRLPILAGRRLHHLHREPSPQLLVEDAIHHPHAAFRQLLLDAVAPDVPRFQANEQRVSGGRRRLDRIGERLELLGADPGHQRAQALPVVPALAQLASVTRMVFTERFDTQGFARVDATDELGEQRGDARSRLRCRHGGGP
jgi:hypothetical protein